MDLSSAGGLVVVGSSSSSAGADRFESAATVMDDMVFWGVDDVGVLLCRRHVGRTKETSDKARSHAATPWSG